MGQRSSAPAAPEGEDLGFFEGTEKRIEVDFAGAGDLRSVPRSEWEEVTRLCQTQILNTKVTEAFTSFLLSESSLLVYRAKAIIKTCGRTVPIQSLPKLWSIAKSQGMEPEWLCYSRKNFLEPAEQPEQHQSHQAEAMSCREACDGVGDAYVLGALTGEHWLLYEANFLNPDCSTRGDLTVDIMMYSLPAEVRAVFFTKEPEGSVEGAAEMTRASGLAAIADMIGAEIDDYCFSPCGYSCNAHAGDAYFTVHVTPQEECSYASFETNFGTSFGTCPSSETSKAMNELVGKVLQAFRPERCTMTLFLDVGGLDAMGGAPFEAAESGDYRRRNSNSYHFESDYIATVANFVRRGSPAEARLNTSRAARLPRVKLDG